jgi:hypothetical protein
MWKYLWKLSLLLLLCFGGTLRGKYRSSMSSCFGASFFVAVAVGAAAFCGGGGGFFLMVVTCCPPGSRTLTTPIFPDFVRRSGSPARKRPRPTPNLAPEFNPGSLNRSRSLLQSRGSQETSGEIGGATLAAAAGAGPRDFGR